MDLSLEQFIDLQRAGKLTFGRGRGRGRVIEIGGDVVDFATVAGGPDSDVGLSLDHIIAKRRLEQAKAKRLALRAEDEIKPDPMESSLEECIEAAEMRRLITGEDKVQGKGMLRKVRRLKEEEEKDEEMEDQEEQMQVDPMTSSLDEIIGKKGGKREGDGRGKKRKTMEDFRDLELITEGPLMEKAKDYSYLKPSQALGLLRGLEMNVEIKIGWLLEEGSVDKSHKWQCVITGGDIEGKLIIS